MTDDPRGPADKAPDQGIEPAADRRNLVYLVPSIPGPDEPVAAGPDPSVAAGTSAAQPVAGGAPPLEGESPGGALAAPATTTLLDPAADLADEPDRQDWAWVQEWRAGGESTPWATGIALGVFSALIVGVAVWVLSAGLADRPVIAVLVNLLVAAGLTPAIWLSRGLPVLRWIAGGAAAGIIIGWVSAILMLPFPS